MATERSRRAASLAVLVVFDIAGPLAVYFSLQSAGVSTVTSLIASGAPPALRVLLAVVRHHRLDPIGALVLAGIAVGTLIGLVSGSAHLVLLDGTVPTAVFGVFCLLTLWSSRPLMLRFALEWMGPETDRGREFASLWQYQGFRHAFRVTTVVWGLSFIVEAAAQAAIVETASTAIAKLTSNLMPLAFLAVVIAWNVFYGQRSRRRGEEAARRGRGDGPAAAVES